MHSVLDSLRESTFLLLQAGVAFLPHLIAAIIVFCVFWALATLIRRSLARGDRSARPVFRHLVPDGVFYVVLGAGAIVALKVLGLNVASFVTGLGLGGVALGFALKDIVSNLVSGLLILSTRAFVVGDQVIVGDTEGTVEKLELRATHVRTYDGRLVVVPNGDVYSARVTNNTQSPIRRASVFVYLDYDQDIESAIAIILETVRTVEHVASSPAPSMRLRDLLPEGVQIEARFWTDSRRTDFMNTASSARRAILAALKRHGFSLPERHDRRKSTPDRAVPGGPDLSPRQQKEA
jgi:small-conductance mechanosensitive channel